MGNRRSRTLRWRSPAPLAPLAHCRFPITSCLFQRHLCPRPAPTTLIPTLCPRATSAVSRRRRRTDRPAPDGVAAGDPLAAATHRRGRDQRRVKVFRGETLVAVSAVLLIGVIVALMFQQTGTGMWLLLFSPIASSLLTAVAGTAFTLALLIARLRSRIARVQLARKHCPACNYDLGGIAASTTASEMITCTECGSRWHAERLGQPANAPPKVIIIARDQH
jgi:hypothetical protein